MQASRIVALALMWVSATAWADGPGKAPVEGESTNGYRIGGWVMAGLSATAMAVWVTGAMKVWDREDEATSHTIEHHDIGDPCSYAYNDDTCREGRNWAKVQNVAVLVAVPSIAASCFLLYKGYSTPTVVPVVGAGTVGASATVRF